MNDSDDLVPGSLVRRWRLGKQLRELREQSGKTMDEAAQYLTVKRPTISRIENGRHAILPKNVKFLCQLYEIGAPLIDTLMRQAEETEERGWWATYSDTMPDWFETYVGFETDAREIWNYEAEAIPGLLQTPEYARGMRAVAPGPLSEADLVKSVEFRLARQQRLVGRPPRLRIVLNEAVVRRPVGNPAQMAAQLRHLANVGREPWANIQVIPFNIGPHLATKGPFSLLTLPDEDGPNFVYLEHLVGALYLERPSDLARYAAVFEHLTEVALSPENSHEFLTTLATQYSGE
ncbi:MAG TPA: helix-turn-helix transcriptional regulator [Pseudonocardiaceae bacterium]|jgi:transcriptional regulator with XRE-family HTH domain|nr:helix-turn-helix transcriptional regulator [Pseudonocardiaceae bacterium]